VPRFSSGTTRGITGGTAYGRVVAFPDAAILEVSSDGMARIAYADAECSTRARD
jgi:hypothetical protein